LTKIMSSETSLSSGLPAPSGRCARAPPRLPGCFVPVDVEAVIDTREIGLAASARKLLRELPEHAELLGPWRFARRAFAGERLADRIEPQVRRDWNALDAGRLPDEPPIRRHLGVQRQRRNLASLGQRERGDDRLGQHRDLAARHVHGRQTCARNGVERRAARDDERGGCDVDADFAAAPRQRANRERIIDLGRRRVVDRECAHLGARELGHGGKRPIGPKRRSLRKGLRKKSVEVIVVRRRNRAASGEQRERGGSTAITRGGERFPFERVLVRLVEQHRQLRAQRVGKPIDAELVAPKRELLAFALLALDRRERRLECLGGRLAIAALAALVEVHRRAAQRHRDRSGFRGCRCAAEVIAREIAEAEFFVRPDFPQEIGIDLGGHPLRVGDERRRSRLAESQQDRGGLDLQALARNGFDLQRCVVVGENRPGLQLAVVLEKDVHWKGCCAQEPPGRARVFEL
jgi:hypothetical protein